jgi:hypothetical protein
MKRAKGEPDEAPEPTGWKISLGEYLNNPTPNFKRPSLTVKNSILQILGRPTVLFNIERRTALFLAAPRITEGFGLLVQALRNHAAGWRPPTIVQGTAESNWQEAHRVQENSLHKGLDRWAFVPVLTFPHGQHNLDYVRECTDYLLATLAGKQDGARAQHYGARWRLAEPMLANYHRFHGLDYEHEELPQRLERLKLTNKFADMLAKIIEPD